MNEAVTQRRFTLLDDGVYTAFKLYSRFGPTLPHAASYRLAIGNPVVSQKLNDSAPCRHRPRHRTPLRERSQAQCGVAGFLSSTIAELWNYAVRNSASPQLLPQKDMV